MIFTTKCIANGYGIYDEDGALCAELSIAEGQAIYRRAKEMGTPEAESLYLRGVVDGLGIAPAKGIANATKDGSA